MRIISRKTKSNLVDGYLIKYFSILNAKYTYCSDDYFF